MSRAAKHIHDHRTAGQGGFTLLEVLITTATFVIVLLPILQMYTNNQQTYTRGEVKTNLQQNARAELEVVSRELRMTGYDPNHTLPLLGAGTTPATAQRAIQSATATTIQFIADVNSPAGTGPDGWGDMVEYAYDPACQQIRRKLWVWNPAATPPNFAAPPSDAGCVEPPPIAELLDPMLTTVFRYFYYDAAETNPTLKFKELVPPIAATDLMRIQRIVIQLGTEDAAPQAGTQEFRLISDVRLRNT